MSRRAPWRHKKGNALEKEIERKLTDAITFAAYAPRTVISIHECNRANAMFRKSKKKRWEYA
jgi:hypothetical protein